MRTPKTPRISIALCTYNGERFLARQLVSIQEQTRLPDELVISDDGSTDRTIEIIREFEGSALFSVKFVRNEKNLGVQKNFSRAIQLCTGSLIALCDQDDIWRPDRLERSEQTLLAHPEAGLTFSDGDIIDDQGRPLGFTLWKNYDSKGRRRKSLREGDYASLARGGLVTGATVMFRSELRDKCLPIGSGWIHDEWIAAAIAAFADVRPIADSLISYRQHTGQQVGLASRLTSAQRFVSHWESLEKRSALLQTLCAFLSEQPLTERGQTVLSSYRAQLRFAMDRATLPASRLARLGAILRLRGAYSARASGILSMAKDFALPRRKIELG